MTTSDSPEIRATAASLDIATADPFVVIEEQRLGYVRYRNAEGRRWVIEGVCDHRGDCLIGAIVDGEVVTEDSAPSTAARYEGPDVPVLPGFSGCCPLSGYWL